MTVKDHTTNSCCPQNDTSLSATRSRTPAETPTPSKHRRISTGLEVDRAPSPIAEEQPEQDDENSSDPTAKRIVIANIPPNIPPIQLCEHLQAYWPCVPTSPPSQKKKGTPTGKTKLTSPSIKLLHPFRAPQKSEIHIYALDQANDEDAHANGLLVKIDLPTPAHAARALRSLHGSRIAPHHPAPLIVRRYVREAAIVSEDAGQKKRRPSGSSSPVQRDGKRQRTGDVPRAKVKAEAGAGAGGAAYPFTFSPPRARGVEAEPEPEPQQQQQPEETEFEDISREVEARLAEQAAKRATARWKEGNGGAVAGRSKRKREGEEGEGEEETCAAIAGMALGEGERARKRVKEEGEGEGEKRGVRRRRRERRRGQMRADESPRPVKRARGGGGEGLA